MIRLEINIGTDQAPDWQEAWLGDVSINMQHVNPVFDTEAGGSFSEEFELDCEMNRHILGNVDEMHGDSIFRRLYRKHFRLSASGIPLLYGIIWIDREVEIEDGTVAITLQSGNKEWNEKLEGKKLQDLDFIEDPKNRVLIGCCLPEYPLLEYRYLDAYIIRDYQLVIRDYQYLHTGWIPVPTYVGKVEDRHEHITLTSTGTIAGLTFPKMMFPYMPDSGIPTTNTQTPYDPDDINSPKFCNIRTCLTRYVQEGDNWVSRRDYNIHEPEDINTAPCFFVAYVMDRIFDALGIIADTSVLRTIPDFYRLALIHSNCAFTYKDEDDNILADYDAEGNKVPGKPVKPWNGDSTEVKKDKNDKNPLRCYLHNKFIKLYFDGHLSHKNSPKTIYCGDSDAKLAGDLTSPLWCFQANTGDFRNLSLVTSKRIGEDGMEHTDLHLRHYIDVDFALDSLSLYKAYATSANLPDIDFSEFLEGIRDGFGLRYLYNARDGRISMVLLRDILSSQDVTDIPCEVMEMYRVEGHTTGFRLKFSAGQELKTNAITGMLYYTRGSDDTVYNYYDSRNAIVFGAEAWKNWHEAVTSTHQTAVPSSYKDMLQMKSDTNMTYYIDEMTGNGYRYKVDSQAKKTQEWYPSLFQVAGFRDVIIGDCSDEDRTETISIGWSPVIENDVNGKAEYFERFTMPPDTDSNSQDTPAATKPKTSVWPKHALFIEGETYAVYVDSEKDTIKEEFLQVYEYTDNAVDYYYDEQGTLHASDFIDATITIEAPLNWDATKNEPFTDGEASFMLGVMRGSGGDAHREIYNTNYDGEDNSFWMDIPGSDAEFSADSVNACGQWYDYNGAEGGLGYESLHYRQEEAHTANAWYLYDKLFPESTVPFEQLRDVFIYTTYGQFNPDGNNHYDLLNDINAFDQDDPAQYIGSFRIEAEAHAWMEVLNKLISIRDEILFDAVLDIPEFTYTQPLSLKLKAEKPYQGGLKKKDPDGKEYLVTDWLSDVREDGMPAYYPIDAAYAKRGLFDKFYTEYAHFVLNRRIAKMKVHMELATLLNIDMTKKYRIGDITGWIKEYSYTVNSSGVSDIEIEMYYY